MNKIFRFLMSFVVETWESPIDISRLHILTSFFPDRASLK